MSQNTLKASLVLAGVAALAAWTGCSRSEAPPTAATNPYAEGHHAASFAEAKAEAAQKNLPLLVDFYSPT